MLPGRAGLLVACGVGLEEGVRKWVRGEMMWRVWDEGAAADAGAVDAGLMWCWRGVAGKG